MILASFRSPLALAADPPCARVALAGDGALAEAWQDALSMLKEEIARLTAADCVPMTLTLASEGQGARLTATSPDGRRGERHVARPSALTATALGLMASIPPEAADAPATSTKKTTPEAVTPVTAAPAKPEREEESAPPPRRRPAKVAPSPSPLAFELALAVGARAGFPTSVLMADVEARADVGVHDWLVAAAVRYAPLGMNFGRRISGYIYDEVALSLGFGRRFHLGEAAVDLTLAPVLAIMTEEGDQPTDGTGGTAFGVRLNTSARLLFGSEARWKPALTLDAELAPGSVSSATRVESALPPLPGWTLGLRAGVVGDLL